MISCFSNSKLLRNLTRHLQIKMLTEIEAKRNIQDHLRHLLQWMRVRAHNTTAPFSLGTFWQRTFGRQAEVGQAVFIYGLESRRSWPQGWSLKLKQETFRILSSTPYSLPLGEISTSSPSSLPACSGAGQLLSFDRFCYGLLNFVPYNEPAFRHPAQTSRVACELVANDLALSIVNREEELRCIVDFLATGFVSLEELQILTSDAYGLDDLHRAADKILSLLQRTVSTRISFDVPYKLDVLVHACHLWQENQLYSLQQHLDHVDTHLNCLISTRRPARRTVDREPRQLPTTLQLQPDCSTRYDASSGDREALAGDDIWPCHMPSVNSRTRLTRDQSAPDSHPTKHYTVFQGEIRSSSLPALPLHRRATQNAAPGNRHLVPVSSPVVGTSEDSSSAKSPKVLVARRWSASHHDCRVCDVERFRKEIRQNRVKNANADLCTKCSACNRCSSSFPHGCLTASRSESDLILNSDTHRTVPRKSASPSVSQPRSAESASLHQSTKASSRCRPYSGGKTHVVLRLKPEKMTECSSQSHCESIRAESVRKRDAYAKCFSRAASELSHDAGFTVSSSSANLCPAILVDNPKIAMMPNTPTGAGRFTDARGRCSRGELVLCSPMEASIVDRGRSLPTRKNVSPRVPRVCRGIPTTGRSGNSNCLANFSLHHPVSDFNGAPATPSPVYKIGGVSNSTHQDSSERKTPARQSSPGRFAQSDHSLLHATGWKVQTDKTASTVDSISWYSFSRDDTESLLGHSFCDQLAGARSGRLSWTGPLPVALTPEQHGSPENPECQLSDIGAISFGACVKR